MHNEELFALPGVIGIGYGTGSTTDVRISVDSLRSGQMVDAILPLPVAAAKQRLRIVHIFGRCGVWNPMTR